MIKLHNIEDFITYPANRAVRLILEGDSMWSDANSIAELFDSTPEEVTRQLQILFESKEIYTHTNLAKGSYYNLDAIIAVGYRLSPKKATMFSTWANKQVREFILQEFIGGKGKKENPKSEFDVIMGTIAKASPLKKK